MNYAEILGDVHPIVHGHIRGVEQRRVLVDGVQDALLARSQRWQHQRRLFRVAHAEPFAGVFLVVHVHRAPDRHLQGIRHRHQRCQFSFLLHFFDFLHWKYFSASRIIFVLSEMNFDFNKAAALYG